MKKLTAFAAIAAFVAGVSLANAQSSMQPGTSGGSMSGGSASTSGAFCLNQQGALNCRFQTMASCQQAAGSSGDCVPNPNRSTTGTGSSGMSGSGSSNGMGSSRGSSSPAR